MNYLEEQTYGEAMINSIQNEKKTRKIDRLVRSLLIQGLPNDIFSLIDSNETAKDLWDALERQMRGSEYGEQDRKAVILYECETFKDNEGEQLLDTYLRYLQVINDLKKCGYKKDNCELNYKFLNNLQSEWKQYGTLMRQTKNLMDINIDALYNILKQNQSDVNDALGYKKKAVVIISANKKQEFVKSNDKKEDKKVDETKRDMSKVKCYNCKKEGHFAKDCKKAKDQAWMESSSDSNQEINANIVFMAQIEKVLSESDESSSSAEETIAEIADQEVLFAKMSVELIELDKHVRDLKNTALEKDFKIYELEECVCNKDLKIEKCLERLNVCENKLHKMGQTNQIVHMIMPLKDNLYNHQKGIGFENPSYFEKAKDLRPTLYDEKVIGLRYTSMFLTHSDEALEIEKFKRSRENKIEFANDYGNLNASYLNELIKFSDDYFQEIINPYFEKIDSLFQQTSSLKSYVPNVILEKIIIDLKDEVVSLLEKEKANLKTIESVKSKGFESSENTISESENQSENDCLVIEKDCDKVGNPKVIAPGMFKLSVSQSVSSNSISKTSCDSKNVKCKLKRKRRETSSVYVPNDVVNVSCNSMMCDLFDDNNFFIFDDESVRISHVSKMPFRKKPCVSINACSTSNSNKSLPRTVHKWLPKLQPSAEPVAKWIPRVKRQIDKISKIPNSPGPIYKWVPKVC
nr:hypothetical protein [Tanacetum cinerariifolium]